MYKVKTSANAVAKFETIEEARAFIAGTDLVIVYSKKARKAYMQEQKAHD
jgi:hypothetical protein